MTDSIKSWIEERVEQVCVCEADDCGREVHCRGLCTMHYQRYKRQGKLKVKHIRVSPVDGMPVVHECRVQGCGRPTVSKGLCSGHDYRFRVNGDAGDTTLRPLTDSPEESFAVRTKWEGECLIWTGAMNRGYGRIKVDGRDVKAHRYAWERVNGPIPDGMVIDHKCWNTACVNVGHLRVATPSENTRYQQPVSNATGVKNVTYSHGKYYVNVVKDKRRYYGGGYADLDEAARVAEALRVKLHGEFAGNHRTVQAIEGAINHE